MHELSIAMALWKGTQQHRPAGSTLRSVRVRIGPLQMIDPGALEFAWGVVCSEQGSPPVELVLDLPPYQLHCTECGHRWESAERFVMCRCGSALLDAPGADELTLMSLSVDEPGDAPPTGLEKENG